jgi:hypothetical protein
MVVIATGVMTLAHPGRCFQGCWSLPTEYRMSEQFTVSESIYGWQMRYREPPTKKPSAVVRDVTVMIRQSE